jgi:hypothetical protein
MELLPHQVNQQQRRPGNRDASMITVLIESRSDSWDHIHTPWTALMPWVATLGCQQVPIRPPASLAVLLPVRLEQIEYILLEHCLSGKPSSTTSPTHFVGLFKHPSSTQVRASLLLTCVTVEGAVRCRVTEESQDGLAHAVQGPGWAPGSLQNV